MFEELDDIQPENKGRTKRNALILIQGQVSSGKSYLAASAASPDRGVVYFSFDKPMAGLQIHPCKEWIHFVDFFDPPPQGGTMPIPTAWNQFMTYIGMLEYKLSQNKISTDMWYVIDSLRYAELSALQQAMHENPKARQTMKVAGSEIYIPYGWDGYKASVVYLTSAIQRLSVLGNLIVIAHERPEEDLTSSSKEKKDRVTGKYTLDPPRLNVLKSLFLDKYRVDSLGIGQWRVYTQTNNEFDGGCTLEGATSIMEASLEKLLPKVPGA